MIKEFCDCCGEEFTELTKNQKQCITVHFSTGLTKCIPALCHKCYTEKERVISEIMKK